MAASRTILIAGAGIAGLTSALAISRHGFGVVLLEQARQLEEAGAGLQLSPNASRHLIGLGLRERLEPHEVVPQELIVGSARTGRAFVHAPLGAAAEQRYGAPYWIIHRADLQKALREAVEASPDIAIRLETRVDDFAAHANGVTVATHTAKGTIEERGIALVGADGLWSRLRARLGHDQPPRFAGYTAWRTLVPTNSLVCELSTPTVNLWLGRGGHLVHYPVKAGHMINVVAIVRDEWREPGWSGYGDRTELLAHFRLRSWRGPPRELLDASGRWSKWALYDLEPLSTWGRGPVTLVGDAAHPMLPYLAQGAAMAIEDAAELGRCIADAPDEPATAMRRYERRRLARTARAQQAAQRNSGVYHMAGVAGFLRNRALRTFGGKRLISRYDWLYGYAPA